MELSEWSMVISTSYGCIRTPHYAGDAFLLKVWEYLAASPSPGTSPGRAIAALSRTRQMSLINYITQVQFEFGAIDLLQKECDRLGIRHPLLVTDPGVRATGLCDKVLGTLADLSHIGIYQRNGKTRGK